MFLTDTDEPTVKNDNTLQLPPTEERLEEVTLKPDPTLLKLLTLMLDAKEPKSYMLPAPPTLAKLRMEKHEPTCAKFNTLKD
jgi:hypothetical protein